MACTLAAIVAVCEDWGIGYEGALLVRNRADMRHFKACTMGRAVIMGRATLASLPGGRPLKGRRNIVLSRDPGFSPAGVEAVRSVTEALAAVAGEDEAWVIGGDSVYRQLLPYCARVEVTKNACVRPADAFFPDLDADPAWTAVRLGEPAVLAAGEGEAGLGYRFVTYARAATCEQGG